LLVKLRLKPTRVQSSKTSSKSQSIEYGDEDDHEGEKLGTFVRILTHKAG